MNKRNLFYVFVLILGTMVLCACGKKKNEMTEDDLRAAIMGGAQNGEYVKILKSDTIENGAWRNTAGEVEFISWEAGYGRSTMKFDIPCFVMKFHVKNTTNEEYYLSKILSLTVVVDGNLTQMYESNVLAESYSPGTLSSTKIPAGAGAECYNYIEIDPENEHVIEITNADGQKFTINYKP